MLKLTNTNGNIELARKMMKGDDGGYYIPSVVDGELTWTPSLEGMAAVDGKVNIVGPKGEPGEPGFYVGTEEPTGEELVWINPDGDSLSQFATEKFVREEIAAIPEVDLTGLATEEFVNSKIEEIPEVDLTGYAKISDIPDTSGLASIEYVDKAISNIEVTGGTENFIVEILIDETYNKATTNKNSLEIAQAYRDGNTIVCRINLDGVPLELTPAVMSDNLCLFTALLPSFDNHNPTATLLTITIANEVVTSTKISVITFEALKSAWEEAFNTIGETYATKDEVSTAWNNAIQIISQNFAQKSEIPDTSAFTTEEDVNTLISNALGVIENGTY